MVSSIAGTTSTSFSYSTIGCYYYCFFFFAVGGDSKKMEAEPKDSLSAADLDMPSLELRSTETFNRGSASDLSMFSSSLPTLLHENLNMTDSDSWLSLDDKLGVGKLRE
uniref:Uncharacterized protein n=1 Tax=Brassica oleracea TaxID=3712 RepID=A0A3P6BGN1_BRAOL|nr:unnamed protein product [Brassica oleracea]